MKHEGCRGEIRAWLWGSEVGRLDRCGAEMMMRNKPTGRCGTSLQQNEFAVGLTAFEAPLGLADGRWPGTVGVELEGRVQVGQADVGIVSIGIITVFLKADELGQVSCVEWGGRGRAILCCGLILLNANFLSPTFSFGIRWCQFVPRSACCCDHLAIWVVFLPTFLVQTPMVTSVRDPPQTGSRKIEKLLALETEKP